MSSSLGKRLLARLRPAATLVLSLLLVLGVLHTGLVWAASRLLFPDAAQGSLIARDGILVGARFIGQAFTDPAYFHPRPSAAGSGYDALASSGTNLGPNHDKLVNGSHGSAGDFAGVAELAREYRALNGLAENAKVPVDAVTRSGSGLDPHISVVNARLQADRVARARELSRDAVHGLIDRSIEPPMLGFLGEPRINVLLLNLALDELTRSALARADGSREKP